MAFKTNSKLFFLKSIIIIKIKITFNYINKRIFNNNNDNINNIDKNTECIFNQFLLEKLKKENPFYPFFP